MDLFSTVPVLFAAAFAAGVLNAIAGGGSFLTFPALVWAGIPPIPANATSALAVSPGYFGSTMGFKAELRALPAERLRREAIIAGLGGIAGALLLLVTPAKLFSGIVPWLLLLATVLFAFGPALARKAAAARSKNESGVSAHESSSRAREIGLAVVSIYGGYFNGGLGILLMALYTLTGERSLSTTNALKNLNSLVLSWVSVAAFIVAGAIAWQPGVLMMAGATLGGYAGAHWSKRLPVTWVRTGVIVVGLVMTAVFFARQFAG